MYTYGFPQEPVAAVLYRNLSIKKSFIKNLNKKA